MKTNSTRTNRWPFYLGVTVLFMAFFLSAMSLSAQTTYDCTNLPLWDAATVYASPTEVQHLGKAYRNKWWTQGDDPSQSGEWGVWTYLGDCIGGQQNQLPTATITAPGSNAFIIEGEPVNIAADASDPDGVVTQVEFFAGTTSLGIDATAPYEVTWTPTVAGDYQLTAVATDDSLGQGTSAPVALSVIGVIPKPHDKEVIGYITQWDAWKTTSAGVPSAGAYTHLNVDYSKYTILNYSFFGVANDGSLHSGDHRSKTIWQPTAQQQPNEIFFTDFYSSWDLLILFGELDPIQNLNQEAVDRCRAQGFEVQLNGTSWYHPVWKLGGGLPVPLHKEDGAPGLLEMAHRNGVKVMASIGGWSMCKHFPEMAADPVKRARFIEDCKLLMAVGFDGIDLDWEYPGPYSGMNFTGTQADYANFLTLVQDIRAAIGPDKLITAAMSASPEKLNGFDWAALSGIMDYFNMMTYDFNGGWSNIAGHNAPIYPYTGMEANFSWQGTLDALTGFGVPRNKINFGIPFYGRGVICDGTADLNAPTVKRDENIQPDGPISTCADYTNWPKDVYDGTPNYSFVKQKTGNGTTNGWTRHWDNEAQVPYLTNGKYFLSYDDEQSVGIKAQYIVDNNLAGTIVWTVYGDLEFGGTVTNHGTKLKSWSNMSHPLIDVVEQKFINGPVNRPPVVSITSPLPNAQFNPNANITITADAYDPDQGGSVTQVEFFQGSTSLGIDNTAPYSITWNNVPQGAYTLRAVATDNELADGYSANVPITVGTPPNIPPTVSISSPSNGDVIIEGNDIVITAVPEDTDGTIAKVDFYEGATLLGTVTTAPYTYTIVAPALGAYALSAVATDDDNDTGTSATVNVTVEVQPTCPEPQYVAGTTYATGESVQNVGNKYRCDVGGWCSSSAAWAYEPGVGMHWELAWTQTGTCTAAAAKAAEATSLTADFLQAYPNPFNAETKIRLNLEKQGSVLLRVYNAQGAEIRTLIDGVLPAGQYEATFNAESLPSGLYFYKASYNGQTATGNLIKQ